MCNCVCVCIVINNRTPVMDQHYFYRTVPTSAHGLNDYTVKFLL